MMTDTERLEELTAALDHIGVFGAIEAYEEIFAQLPQSDLACELEASIDARRGRFQADKALDPRYFETWTDTVGALGLTRRMQCR